MVFFQSLLFDDVESVVGHVFCKADLRTWIGKKRFTCPMRCSEEIREIIPVKFVRLPNGEDINVTSALCRSVRRCYRMSKDLLT